MGLRNPPGLGTVAALRASAAHKLLPLVVLRLFAQDGDLDKDFVKAGTEERLPVATLSAVYNPFFAIVASLTAFFPASKQSWMPRNPTSLF